MPSPLRVQLQLQLRIVSDDDTVIRDEVILQLDKSGDRLETIGLCLEAPRIYSDGSSTPWSKPRRQPTSTRASETVGAWIAWVSEGGQSTVRITWILGTTQYAGDAA